MTAATLFEKFDQVAGTRNSIPHLRELVIQLAMKGRLAPNDSTEHPVELPALRSDRTGTFENWRSGFVGNAIALEYGKNLPKAKRSGTGEFPVYGSNGIVGTHNKYLTKEPAIIVGRKGSAGALNVAKGPSWTTDVAYFVCPPPVLDLRYVYYLLAALHLKELGKGIKPGLSRSEAYELPISLPPLAEQKRIVAKVDELMALCDRLEVQQQERETRHTALARASLARFADAPTQANVNFLFHKSYTIPPADLRKSILTLAIQGKLVPQNSSDEPAKRLIEKLRRDKERLIAQRKMRRPRKLPPIANSDIPYNIPDTWAWCRLGEIGNALDSAVVDGPFGQSINVKTDYVTEGVPVIRMVNVKPFRFVPDDLRFISEEKFSALRRHNILHNDVLLGKVGSIGLCAIYPDSMPEGMLATTGLCRFRVGEAVEHQYLCQFLNGIADHLRSVASEAVQPFLNMKTIGSVMFPLPPLPEQRRIVAKVDRLMALVDQLEAQLADSRATGANLLEAVVAELTA